MKSSVYLLQDAELFQAFNVSLSTMNFERNLPRKLLVWDATSSFKTCVGDALVLVVPTRTVIGVGLLFLCLAGCFFPRSLSASVAKIVKLSYPCTRKPTPRLLGKETIAWDLGRYLARFWI